MRLRSPRPHVGQRCAQRLGQHPEHAPVDSPRLDRQFEPLYERLRGAFLSWDALADADAARPRCDFCLS
jgi:hypothetical protein